MKIKFYSSFFLSFLFICSTSSNLFGQWLDPHPNVTIGAVPNSSSFEDMIGITVGKGIQKRTDSTSIDSIFPVRDIIKNFRAFHLMESDFNYSYTPINRDMQVSNCPDNPYCGDESCGAGFGLTGFGDWKSYYDAWDKHYGVSEIYASLEVIDIYRDGSCSNTPPSEGRKYPNKWYTRDEWGTDSADIRNNAKKYIQAFAASFCPDEDTCLVKVF